MGVFHGKYGGTIFVDALRDHVHSGDWKHGPSCHFFTLPGWEDDLHELAQKLGLRRAWFQETTMPHYDLNATFRGRAVRAGAVEMDRKETVDIIRMWRKERARLMRVALTDQASEADGWIQPRRARAPQYLTPAEVMEGFGRAREALRRS